MEQERLPSGSTGDFRQTILIVDDDDMMLSALNSVFCEEYHTVLASSGPESVAKVGEHGAISCVIMDIKMAGMDGITAAREIRKSHPDLPVIFHTGYPGDYVESEIDQKEKPFDYVTKGESLYKLVRSVRNAVETHRLRTDAGAFARHGESRFGMIGRSQVMREVIVQIQQAANSDARVMILGETGTGKELVAQAIHNCGRRQSKRLAILNCNHKSPDLVESELFGHVRGAFTGALADRIGKFEYADGGTLFLDEIGDLDITTQAKLLRALESGEYQRIGEPNCRKADVRLICATNRDLEKMVTEGGFREDLFYRLKGIVIIVPPLRERREDIPFLVENFLEKLAMDKHYPYKMVDQSAMELLVEYHWPGNVRWLLNTIESLVTLTSSDLIVADDVRRQFEHFNTIAPDRPKRLIDRIKDLERTLIITALTETRYNVTAAADILGIDPSNLHKKIRVHGINISTLRD